jgi:hypothetical protein
MQPQLKRNAEAVRQRYVRRIAHAYFVRFHMSLILGAVIASGVLTSKGLLALGVYSLPIRYPLGVLASYLAFLGLVRVWIWYVSIRGCVATGKGVSVGNIDLDVPGSGGSGSGFRGFGGGDSGGGGASDVWDSGAEVPSASSGWLPKLDLDCDLDDGWWILLLLAILVFAIVGGGVYLVYAAPHILPEAAGQAVLAGTLTRISKETHHNWMRGVLRATCLPFAIVLILASLLAWQAHRYCPSAPRLIDVFRCPSSS